MLCMQTTKIWDSETLWQWARSFFLMKLMMFSYCMFYRIVDISTISGTMPI